LRVVFELIGGLENNLSAPHMHASSMEANPAPAPRKKTVNKTKEEEY
jgi:hypothetical protein